MAAPAMISAFLAAMFLGSTALEFCPVECYCDETGIHCVEAGLFRPPVGYWPECNLLNFNENNISTLNKYSLTGFPDLEYVYLGNNLLTDLDFEVYAVAPKLKYIVVSNNLVDTILPHPSGVQLANVEHLYLDGTEIASIDTDLLESTVPSLETLSIDNTPLACDCLFEDLYLWAEKRGVILHSTCKGLSRCSFLPQQPCPFECSCQDTDMNCDNTDLYHPPVGLWTEYHYLHISGNSISVLYNYTFTGFPNVTWMYLGNNGLQILDLSVFAGVPNLEYLDILHNNIALVVGPPDGVQWPHLYSFIVDGNNISSLDTDLLENTMPALEFLSFDDTPLACDCAYKDLYMWAQERDVALSASCNGQNDCIISCPTQCTCASSTMTCRNAELTQVPSGNYPGYTSLYIESNDITTIDKESLQGYPDLQMIDLEYNKLTVLDLDAFSVLPNLRHLFVWSNNIESILAPSDGVQLQNLHTLYIGYNNIASIDIEMLESATPYIADINIQDTPLACDCAYQDLYLWAQEKEVALYAHCHEENLCSFVPCPEECRCERSTMFCQYAELTQVPSGDYPGYVNLYIGGNNIATVDKESLLGYPDLQMIDLESNQLTVLDLDVFSALPNLRQLYIWSNDIESIVVPSDGVQLQNLHTLNIRNSKITTIDTDMLESATPHIAVINIQDTPLACACAYEDLYLWSEEKDVALSASCNGQGLCSFVTCPEQCRCANSTMFCQYAELFEIPSGEWPGYVSLYLESNNITIVDKESLLGYPDLQKIDLEYNQLTVLDLDVFSVLPNLTHLYVWSNNIDSILAPSDGVQLQNLHTLNIANNDIRSIDINMLETATPNIADIDIHDTPLACECAYQELYLWTQVREIDLSVSCNGQSICPVH